MSNFLIPTPVRIELPRNIFHESLSHIPFCFPFNNINSQYPKEKLGGNEYNKPISTKRIKKRRERYRSQSGYMRIRLLLEKKDPNKTIQTPKDCQSEYLIS
jgi:hypothetical protein